jgi:hypothetical protein
MLTKNEYRTFRSKKGRWVAAAIAFAIFGADACGGSGSSPSPTIAGTWRGAVRDNVAGDGTIEFRQLSEGAAVTGQWAMVMANRYQLSGSLAGTVDGDTVKLHSTALDYTMGDAPYYLCGFEWSAVLSANRLTGTHRSVNCAEASIEGSFQLSR